MVVGKPHPVYDDEFLTIYQNNVKDIRKSIDDTMKDIQSKLDEIYNSVGVKKE